MISETKLVELLVAGGAEARDATLAAHRERLGERAFSAEIVTLLKQRVDETLRQSATDAEVILDTLNALVAITQDPEQQALALRATGNFAIFGRNDYESAVTKYEQAAAIYQQADDQLGWASSLVGVIAAYGYLSQLDRAEAIAEQVQPIFAAHEQWQSLYSVLLNLSVHYSRRGLMARALQLIDQAEAMAHRHGLEAFWANLIILNRSYILRNMGRLDDAAREAIAAEQAFRSDTQAVYVAHAQTSRGITYIAQGRYNEALALFDQARETYIASQLPIDAIWIDLFATDCWLQLGRYDDVLRLSEAARAQFAELNLQRDLADAIVSEAVAYAALNRYDEAHASFEEAQQLFDSDNNPSASAICRLEQATVLLRQRHFDRVAPLAEASLTTFAKLNQPLHAAQAQLLMAQTAYAAGRHDEVLAMLTSVETVAAEQLALWLTFQVHALRARVMGDSAEPAAALPYFAEAIATLERLRGRLMTEFRADFLQDKEDIYGDAVALCLELGQPLQALDYAERARSRALVDLIAYRLDLSIEPRAERDRELVSQLRDLQMQRNSVYRRWMDGESDDLDATRQQMRQFEEQVTQLWHQLMVRNADYARDASLTSVRSEPIQPYLDADTLMLNFFVHGDEIVLFLISACSEHVEVAETIKVHRLPNSVRKLGKLMRQLNLNLRSVANATPERVLKQLPNARRLLKQLHTLLFGGIEPELARFAKLQIVPHGAALHYLPFHALFDGARYLCQTHVVSYLPSASLLHYQQGRVGKNSAETTTPITYAIGYSNNNLLPYASEEAERIAKQVGGIALSEASATIANVRNAGRHATLLHLSTHGDFNQSNPLFSGLALADGQLSTLDIFNLQINASLVTLSACQTGRSVVKGGDELQGLSRAFLYAGASSLLVSLWQVHDRSTLLWMDHFYHHLMTLGKSKASAVQSAQRTFILAQDTADYLAHPWFWAPFFLMGDTGKIMP